MQKNCWNRCARLAALAGAAVVALVIGSPQVRAGAEPPQSIARQWNEENLAAIRIDIPRPPVHARNLYHLSVAMWDAWAAYDPVADQVMHHEKATAADIAAARHEAISYAAYRIIRWRYFYSANGPTTTAALEAKFLALGYNKNNTSTVGDTPAALGNRIYTTIRDAAGLDGSNEYANYSGDPYLPVNPPLIFKLPGITLPYPNRWQPLAFDFFITQNGIPQGALIQTFVCPHWNQVESFALTRENPDALYIDPGLPPLFGGATDAQHKAEMLQVVEFSNILDPTQPAGAVLVDISPAGHHNNPLGTNDGTGYPVNPHTGLPYTPNMVPLGDYARVLAEFWADGPQSETPPGHWNTLANYVSDHPDVVKQLEGEGDVLDDLEWDVKLYLALNGAEHDAAVASWGVKGVYDSVRPISGIRWLCQNGQSSDPGGPSYHPDGMPLVPGVVEVITALSAGPGQRHAHLAPYIGEIAIRSWRGEPAVPTTQLGGVGWIRGITWMPYQRKTFVTPPFAGYISGHSTYSRTGAEVLTGFTGDSYFPGGFGMYHAEQNQFLFFEEGPSVDVDLQWARYYDAADEAGISRLYGGIHIEADDFAGRRTGNQVGIGGYAQAKRYFDGRISMPADLNADRMVDVADLGLMLNAFGEENPFSPADINGDGVVDTADLGMLLNDFGMSR